MKIRTWYVEIPKLPRKSKKIFIKKFGRKAYHSSIKSTFQDRISNAFSRSSDFTLFKKVKIGKTQYLAFIQ